MSRYLSNRFRGRKKETDMEVNIVAAKGLIRSIDTCNLLDGINLEGHCHWNKKILRGEGIQEAVDFIDKYFKESPIEDLTMRYQVFSGKKTERHYFDLSYTFNLETERFGRIPTTVRQATIDYLLKVDS